MANFAWDFGGLSTRWTVASEKTLLLRFVDEAHRSKATLYSSALEVGLLFAALHRAALPFW